MKDCLFRVQKISLRILFFEVYLFESSFVGSKMINTFPPVSLGSLAASRPATAARNLAILPRMPGEIVYYQMSRAGFYGKDQ